MATFPPLPQIVGKHGGIYEAYYMQADPLGTGSIGALDAANFLKKSKIKDTTLSQVWDHSDPMGKGYLEKTGFFVALKLIALVQNSQEMSVSKLTMEIPPPDLGPVEPITTPVQTAASSNVPWEISLSEKSKYDKVFDSLLPVNNLLGGDKVKPVLMNSKLPVDVLGKIWDLSDIDKDGCLDRDEFAVAMHLVYQAREGQDTPSILKPGLVPPSKRKGGPPPPLAGAVPVLPMGVTGGGVTTPLGRSTPPVTGVTSPPPWVVSQTEKASHDITFSKLDTDGDGLVSGAEMRDVLAQSGLPNNLLAHIWSLCDSQNQGKLTSEQYALAMHLIQQKLKGVEVPSQMTPEMIPPSQRSVTDPGAFGVIDGPNAGPYNQLVDHSSMKELDQISREIEDIKKERLQLERDKAQKEADVKIRQSEVQVLQKEMDSLNGTLTQLDTQKKEAQKRLDELDDKRSNLERNVKEMREKTNTEQMEVNKMKSLLNNRDQMIKDQEGELSKLRQELTQLRDEESKLEQTVDSSKQQLEMLTKSQVDINTEIEQTKSRIQQFKNQYNGVENGITATTGNGLASVEPISSMSSLSGFSSSDDFKEDPFKGQDPFGQSSTLSQADPFQSDDPFKDSDPFKSSDPFGSEDPFKDAFGGSSNNTAKSDPFASQDGFGGLTTTNTSSKSNKKDEGFDAFGGSSWGNSFSNNKSSSQQSSDPFGDLGSKPSQPAKTKKAPPPRPAPPKSKSPLPFNSSAASKPKVEPFAGFDSQPFGDNDPFSSTGSTKTANNANSASNAFANFADFSPGKFDEDSTLDGPSTITIKDTGGGQQRPANQNVVLAGDTFGGLDTSDA